MRRSDLTHVKNKSLGALALGVALLMSSGCDGASSDRPQVGIGYAPVGFTLPSSGQPLASFFDALQDIETGRRSEPVKIVHFGDSHTASDRFTGALRKLLQERFGNAGRGTLAAGVPYDYYRPTNVEVKQTSGWRVFNSWERGTTGLFGTTGFRLKGTSPSSRMSLQSVEPEGFDRVALTVVLQPGGGSLTVDVDGRKTYTVPTAGDHAQAAKVDVPVAPGSRQVTLSPVGNGAVELLSWSFERNHPGVVYDSYGISGATMDVMGGWAPDTVAWELRQRNPSLIVVSYGTNEGFNDMLNLEVYEKRFAERLRMLADAAPNASILVMGPPDAARYPKRCPQSRQETAACRPLNRDDLANYHQRFVSNPGGNSCVWHTPPNIAAVRDIQRRTALGMGFAFWDWSRVMGGTCGANKWARNDPPLAYKDRIHYRQEGAEISAGSLFDAILRGYASHRSLGSLDY